MYVTLAEPTTFELRLCGEQDERAGMILCRLFHDEKGDAVLMHQAIATAFGKKDRRDVQNHMQQFERLGKSLAHLTFHHLQAVRARLRERCGTDWRRHALLCTLVDQVDSIYRCRDRRTAQKRLDLVMAMRAQLAEHHPAAIPVLDIIKERFPLVANALGRDDIPLTNNITERTIKAFHKHYRGMAGFEAIDTARIQANLFRFFYRLTPMPEATRPEHRGLCPLERAGWNLAGVPIADYIRRFTQAWESDGPDLLVAPEAGPEAALDAGAEARPVAPTPLVSTEPVDAEPLTATG